MNKIIKLLKTQERIAQSNAYQFKEGTPGRAALQAEADTLNGIISILQNRKARAEIFKAWGVTK